MTEQEYNNLPQDIKDVVDSWDDNKDIYAECRRIRSELEQMGWTCDYGLDGEVYDVRKVNGMTIKFKGSDITFDVESEDFWTSFECDGKTYDLHYCEDYDTISIYPVHNDKADYSNITSINIKNLTR